VLALQLEQEVSKLAEQMRVIVYGEVRGRRGGSWHAVACGALIRA
jgi:hypothetical protein